MSKQSDIEQMVEIKADAVAAAIYKTMMKIPMEERLYPELYSKLLAEKAVAAYLAAEETRDHTEWKARMTRHLDDLGPLAPGI